MEGIISEKQAKKLLSGREYRNMSIRAVDFENQEAEGMYVEGYATTFNQPYIIFENQDIRIFEQVSSNAFDGADLSDVIMQYDHEGHVFARNKNDTLNLMIDNIGLKIRADLSGTTIGRQLYQEIKGGYTDKMSYAFIVGDEIRQSTMVDGIEIINRTITQIKKVYDVSAVSIPANDMTSISARRYFDGVIENVKAERLLRTKMKIKILMEV